ncbi:MAG: methyltransferase domain-containing protein [Thermoleophilaceae bacterium]|nr:methyltransferase domain-containing protein [Thermoleophilaceae bacterium]
MSATVPLAGEDLAREVASATWYHSLELPGGVVTPGEYDLRPALERIPFPASLAGRRCLDVGTRDGFWAFEMERRGAEAVVGIDLDDPTELDWPQPRPEIPPEVRADLDARSRCFGIAAAAHGSKVDRRNLSVYDLAPDTAGEFDFAFLGTLLLHLRDPVGALMAVRRVTTGRLLLNEVVSTRMSVLGRGPSAALMSEDAPFWWIPNAKAVRRYAEAAGWRVVGGGRPYLLRNGEGALAHERHGAGIAQRTLHRLGAPHVWLELEPR